MFSASVLSEIKTLQKASRTIKTEMFSQMEIFSSQNSPQFSIQFGRSSPWRESTTQATQYTSATDILNGMST